MTPVNTSHLSTSPTLKSTVSVTPPQIRQLTHHTWPFKNRKYPTLQNSKPTSRPVPSVYKIDCILDATQPSTAAAEASSRIITAEGIAVLF